MNGIDFKNGYLLDTCFMLGLYNGNPNALNQMVGVSFKKCAISIITEIELLGYANIDPNDEILLAEFVYKLPIFQLSQEIKDLTIELRKRHKIKLPDCIVLATALIENRQLLTLDIGLANKFLKETSH